MFRKTATAVLFALAGCSAAPRTTAAPLSGTSLPGMRIVESSSGRDVSADDMIAAASRADIVFFGEQHDDPETHFAELALLEGIGRVRPNVVLSLEMFERDVQPVLDAYLAGTMSESDFLAKSRPWDRYSTDYRGLVMLARARGWHVVASDIPRPIASAVSRRGLAALDTLSPASREYVARDISCPHDPYYEHFAEEMKGHSAGGGPPTAADAAAATAITDRFYQAQCVKDETMGESIARALAAAGKGAIVIHFDGAFHSDYSLGTVARAIRRAPHATRVVISAIPVTDPSAADAHAFATRADFILFTKAAPK